MSEAYLRLDRAAVEAREIDGDLVIYDLGTRRYLGGNRTAAMLWPLLVEGTDVDALAEALAAGFEIDHDRARADAAAFVDSLRAHGLLIE